jgi:hypothetical protein
MRIITILLAVAISNPAFVQTASQPLSPGKPAGVHQAQMALFGDPVLIAVGVAAVAAGIAIAASSHSSKAVAGNTTVTTTTTTGTSP